MKMENILNCDINGILAMDRHKLFIKSGIYFLIHKREIVYIGKSSNIMSRVLSHYPNKNMRFDSFTFVIVEDPKIRAELEEDLIYKHRPKYNKTIKESEKEKP